MKKLKTLFNYFACTICTIGIIAMCILVPISLIYVFVYQTSNYRELIEYSNILYDKITTMQIVVAALESNFIVCILTAILIYALIFVSVVATFLIPYAIVLAIPSVGGSFIVNLFKYNAYSGYVRMHGKDPVLYKEFNPERKLMESIKDTLNGKNKNEENFKNNQDNNQYYRSRQNDYTNDQTYHNTNSYTNNTTSELDKAKILFMIDDLTKIDKHELKKIRNRLIKALHPDATEQTKEDQDLATEQVKKINNAYELLSQYVN